MRPSMILTFVLAVSACGGGAASGGFDALSASQKMELMKGTVTPNMKADFHAFDATDYADFDCKSCHGANASAKHFKMPNPDLPKLDVEHGFAKDKAAHPKAMEFMQQKVQPRMAKMLGQPEHSTAHPDGFGCMDCHTKS
jgi:hypothetical protein